MGSEAVCYLVQDLWGTRWASGFVALRYGDVVAGQPRVWVDCANDSGSQFPLGCSTGPTGLTYSYSASPQSGGVDSCLWVAGVPTSCGAGAAYWVNPTATVGPSLQPSFCLLATSQGCVAWLYNIRVDFTSDGQPLAYAELRGVGRVPVIHCVQVGLSTQPTC